MECGAPTVVSALVADPSGGVLMIVWTVNGAAVQTNSVTTSGPAVTTNISFIASLPLGTNVVQITAANQAGNSASCSTMVDVLDTTPPVVTAVTATPNVLWPPDHNMVAVNVEANVTDTGGPTAWKIISVTSNEALTGRHSSHTAADWQITGEHTVKLRADRSGNAHGRVYTITVQATDERGNLSQPATVTVTVAHTRPRNHRN